MATKKRVEAVYKTQNEESKINDVTAPVSQVVEELAKLGCTMNEIGRILSMDARKLWRDHREHWDKGNGDLIKRLRGAQIDKALVEKNAQMLIHLGKHYLQQNDNISITNVEEEAVEEMDSADLIALVKNASSKD